jgi:hypothetical protein
MISNIDKFKRSMIKNGLKPPKKIIADGKMHCFTKNEVVSDVTQMDDGWYIYREGDLAIGMYGKGHESHKWASIKPSDRSSDEDAECKEKFNKMKRNYSNTLSANMGEIVTHHEVSGDEAVVSELSLLTEFDYDRVRKEEAKRLNIKAATLDKAVRKARKLAASIRSQLTR